jgi:hypothetical protein
MLERILNKANGQANEKFGIALVPMYISAYLKSGKE